MAADFLFVFVIQIQLNFFYFVNVLFNFFIMIYMHLNFCCVTVDAINETMAAYLNETDLFGGE